MLQTNRQLHTDKHFKNREQYAGCTGRAWFNNNNNNKFLLPLPGHLHWKCTLLNPYHLYRNHMKYRKEIMKTSLQDISICL